MPGKETYTGALSLISIACTIMLNHLDDPFRVKTDLENVREMCNAILDSEKGENKNEL